MPIKSANQYAAMAAAAHGRGTTGIPQDVAREMLEKTPPATRSRFAKTLARRRKLRRRHRREGY
jgi:hypothetical protein